MDEQINRRAEADDADGETDDGDNGVQHAGLLGNARRLFFLVVHEAAEFIFQRIVDGVFVFQFQREPAAFETFPFFRQAREDFRVRRLKTPARPERRSLLRPDAEDAVVGGERQDAFPKQLSRGVGDGKIRVILGVEPGVLPQDLQSQGAGEMTAVLDDLKFRETAFEFVRRQPRRRPERLECGQVVHGGAADMKFGRNHGQESGGKMVWREEKIAISRGCVTLRGHLKLKL